MGVLLNQRKASCRQGRKGGTPIVSLGVACEALARVDKGERKEGKKQT